MDLSIVIPALNESRKIAQDVKAAAEFLQQQNLEGEIIVVDDGSSDDTTQVARHAGDSIQASLRVLHFKEHHGKGFAVKNGIIASKSQFVMFADSGLCVPYSNVLKGLSLLQNNSCDIAHGSRKLPESIIRRPQPLGRRIISKLIHWVLIIWLRIPANLTDTQCGFKIYKGDLARELYKQCISNGFLFDIEIIIRALKSGKRIREFPIEWTADPDSRLSPAKNFIGVLSELFALKKIVKRVQRN
ncbi:MAG: glycosyltransferase [Calditrichaeota bacterium]|nr:glycosyltransferase [Calditrichota bacterium]